jgi:hypothetical protein
LGDALEELLVLKGQSLSKKNVFRRKVVEDQGRAGADPGSNVGNPGFAHPSFGNHAGRGFQDLAATLIGDTRSRHKSGE